MAIGINEFAPSYETYEYGATPGPPPIIVEVPKASRKKKTSYKVSKPAENVFAMAAPAQRASNVYGESTGQGALAFSEDGGKTWIETPPQEAYAPGYDLNRGLDIMDAVMAAYPNATPEDAAAVAGNFMQESYGIPNIYEGQNPQTAGKTKPDKGGFGVAQWTGPRRTALMQMENPELLDTQIRYFQQENAGPEASNWAEVLSAPNLNAKTETFMREWERPGVPALENRINFANSIYDLYNNRQRMLDALMTPITRVPVAPVDIVRPNLDANLMLRQPRLAMPVEAMTAPPQEIPTIGSILGVGPAIGIPYERTPQYQEDVLRRLQERELGVNR